MSSRIVSPATILMLLITFFVLLPSLGACMPIVDSSPSAQLSSTTRYPDTDRADALQGPACCFANDCLSWSLDSTGRILHGVCYNKRDQRGHWTQVASQLDLSNCVGNFNGILLPASAGAYSKTCEECSLDGTTLTCLCKTPAGVPRQKATVDLNAFVQDYDGSLKCFNYVGTPGSH